MVKEQKVLIVGAGPAGCSTAFFLKHLDKEHIFNVDLAERLSEKKYELYHDMCGEGISSALLDEIHPLKPDGIVQDIHTIFEFWPGDITITSPIHGHLLNRSLFLQSIREEFKDLGGNILTDSVTSVVEKNNSVKVNFKKAVKTYDYIVAADGPNSLIRKQLGLSANTTLFLQHIINKSPEEGIIKFFYDEKYKGDYLWEFPHEDNVKIGYPAISKNLVRGLKKIVLTQSKYICYGGIDNYSHGRILLVGDAAGQTNAFTKGGIRSGMNAGKLAAQAIIKDDPSWYDKEWKKTHYSSQKLMHIYNKLQHMNNEELAYHMRPFKNLLVLTPFKILLFYRKYYPLYRAYDVSTKYGW